MSWWDDFWKTLADSVKISGNPMVKMGGGGQASGLAAPPRQPGKFSGTGGTFAGDPVRTANQAGADYVDDFAANHQALDKANADSLRHGIDPFTLMPVPEDPLDKYYREMNAQFNFDPSKVDTSFIQDILNQRNAAIQAAHDSAQGNFNTSDANVAGMTDAYRNQQLAQAPIIQGQYDKLKQDSASGFDQVIADNAKRQADYKAQQAEMFQRLGIAPAANQPDIVSQTIEQGNQTASRGKNAAQTELTTNNQNALDRNNNAAAVLLQQGQQSRADLNKRLLDIFGALDAKKSDYSAQAAQARADYINQARQGAYGQFDKDRSFAQEQYNTLLKLRQDADIANMRYSGQNGANDPQGLTQLNQMLPDAQKDYYAILSEAGKDANFDPNNLAQVAAFAAKRLPPDRANNVMVYLQNAQNLTKMKNLNGFG